MTDDDTVLVPAGTLTWARERVSMDLTEAATEAKQSPTDLQDWENGERVPLDVLRGLAKVYEVPLSAFLWSNPKKEPLTTVDRRKYAGVDDPRTTPELAKALRRSAGLQTLASRLRRDAVQAAASLTSGCLSTRDINGMHQPDTSSRR